MIPIAARSNLINNEAKPATIPSDQPRKKRLPLNVLGGDVSKIINEVGADNSANPISSHGGRLKIAARPNRHHNAKQLVSEMRNTNAKTNGKMSRAL